MGLSGLAGTYAQGGPPAGMDLTATQIACFEAGVKFGSLYHQFAGTPVSRLARAMESAIENQPHCRSVTVTVQEEALAADLDPEHGYTELTGRHFEAEAVIDYEGVTATARMAMADGDPLMKLESVEEPD
jgi:hypothetical protein